MKRPGLRTRVTAGFAIGAAVLSAVMAVLSYQLTQRFLLAERERNATRITNLDANVVRAGLSADRPDIVALLRSLDTGANRRPAVRRGGTWYLRNADSGITASIPQGLQRQVESGQPSVQRVGTANGPALVIGIPLEKGTSFYIVDSMNELDRSLKVLSVVLTLVAIMTTVAGALLGRYAARYVLRPLTEVARTARTITAGDLSTRLDPAAEPELSHLADSFNQMVDQLSARMQRDRRFAADVSHELRSPLQTLAAAASVLQRRKDQLDDRSAEAATLVFDEVTRFQRLVTDLLELARSDHEPDRSPTDVAELARQACVARGLPPNLVTVEDPVDTIWEIDQRRFERILGNLLDNAQRYGGGPVEVHIGRCHGERCLRVDDDGPGINPTERDTIFGRFVRGRTAHARGDSDGTGLGLALVAEHVKAHGGHVTVVDRPGGGARFSILLPEQQS